MSAMYVFNNLVKALCHQEAWLQSVALTDRSALSQKQSLTTTLRLCTTAGRDWLNIPGKSHYNTNMLHPIVKARELKAKLKQKQSCTSPCSTLTQTNTGVALLEEQEAKNNFLLDKLLALPCSCSYGHHQSPAINPSQNNILPLNHAFSVSLLLQLSVLAHFRQNKSDV